MEKDISCPLALFTILLVGLALASGEDASTTNTKLTGSSVCRVDETSRGEEERAIVERQSAAPLKQSADSVEDDAASTQQSAKVDAASPQESSDSAEQGSASPQESADSAELGSASPQESADSAKKQGAEVAKEEPASEWKKCDACDGGRCKACNGSGVCVRVTCKVCLKNRGKCVVCNGEGRLPANKPAPDFHVVKCYACQGTNGDRGSGFCSSCKGTREFPEGEICFSCKGLGLCRECSGAGLRVFLDWLALNNEFAPGDSTFNLPRYESYTAYEPCDRCGNTGNCVACLSTRVYGDGSEFCRFCSNTRNCNKCGGRGKIETTKKRIAY